MRQHDRHRGFTLLELLLVLGLIAAMVGLAWPALRGSLGGARLREAAKQVRVELSRTRLAAIESDAVYELQYSLAAGRFRVRCLLDLNPAEEGEECALPDATDSWNVEADVEPVDGSTGWAEFNLPERVVFADPATLLDEEVDPATEWIETVETSTVAAWSSPIVFYPNGTSTSAEVVLRNDRGEQMVIRLRGLTGVSQIADRAAPERLVR